ncbi:hypothetical protein CT676_07145 [Bradyrhizobium sp. MOS001]|uniref:hypothetical protein n=1 Tax=unclassified Bradyrhizobium TaxID=2631580 RepID=UPI0010753082|nr:hypothetical protein [Bradyrhizobium sp. MOS001]TFW61978.1 hypothetical protein CT676_07145 [Bradyrhizobium sp. MOS001]
MVLSAKGIALRGERARAHSASTIASKNESDARIWRIDRRRERYNELAHAHQREGLIKRK